MAKTKMIDPHKETKGFYVLFTVGDIVRSGSDVCVITRVNGYRLSVDKLGFERGKWARKVVDSITSNNATLIGEYDFLTETPRWLETRTHREMTTPVPVTSKAQRIRQELLSEVDAHPNGLRLMYEFHTDHIREAFALQKIGVLNVQTEEIPNLSMLGRTQNPVIWIITRNQEK